MGNCALKVLCPAGVQFVQMLIRLDTAAMERLHLSGIAGKANVIYTLRTVKSEVCCLDSRRDRPTIRYATSMRIHRWNPTHITLDGLLRQDKDKKGLGFGNFRRSKGFGQ
jgi:hypothetical protein